MESRIAPDFLSDIPRRNTPYYTIIKLFVRFTLLFVLAFLSGMMFSVSKLGQIKEASEIYMKISKHFSDTFLGCRIIRDYFSVIFTASATDIRYLVLIFVAGFTYFSGIASYAFVVCRGFSLGFSITFLYNSVKNGSINLQNPSIAICIFTVTEIVIAFFIIFLATRSLIFSYDFKKIRGRHALIMRSQTIYKYIILYLTAFGLMIFINAVSCFASLILLK